MNQSKLHITIVGLNYAPEPTGNAPYTASLAEGLSSMGHTVRVVTGYPHYPEWTLRHGYSGWTRREILNGVEVTRLRHYIPQKATMIKRLHMELSFGVRTLFARWGQPDVVLVVSPALFSSSLAIARARMLPSRPAVAIWVQDLYSRGVVETQTGNSLTGKLAQRTESLILGSTDGVVAIHERFRQFIVGALGLPAHKVSVIRNWTHLPTAPKVDVQQTRARLGWLEGQTIVLHSGNMGLKQGLGNVIQAARLAQDRKSHVKFVLVGDGNQRPALEAMGAGLTHLEFVPPLPSDEYQKAMAAADILLVNELPGVKDMAVPSKLTSYFNTGVPVIAATDIGSVTAAEIETSGGGIRVDAANPQALLEAAESLGREPARAKALGAHGLIFRQETLSESAAISDYDGLITSLASSRSR